MEVVHSNWFVYFHEIFTHAKKDDKKKKKVSLDTVDSEYLFNKVGQNKKTGKFAQVFLSEWGRRCV